MITRITIELADAKSAKEFGKEVAESLDGLAAAVAQMTTDKKTVTLSWDESLDPTELLEAMTSAIEEMDWEF